MKKKHAAKESPAFSPADLTPSALMAYFTAVRRPRRADDILRDLHIPRRWKKNLHELLHAMAAPGRPGSPADGHPPPGHASEEPKEDSAGSSPPCLLRLPGGAYVPLVNLKEITGTLRLHSSGAALVIPDSGKGDIIIAPSDLGEAWQGDRVSVLLFPGRSGSNRAGRIRAILKKSSREMIVRVARTVERNLVLAEPPASGPVSGRSPVSFLTDIAGLPERPDRDSLLLVRLEAHYAPGLWRATALAVPDAGDAVPVQEAIVKAGHGIPTAFPQPVLDEAEALPSAPAEEPGPEAAQRKDLTPVPFVTIDGDKARDFDDAIHVERREGGYRLRVAIADVAHYVRPGSALDQEAARRGNSCYFPLSVEPMLPEALSNGLCSLNPGQPRLVLVAVLLFTAEGAPGPARFYPALIKSSARLTYDQVRMGLLEGDAETAKALGPALPMLRTALELARALAATRNARGSLDFELPEPAYIFGPGNNLLEIIPATNSFANRLIEEFMIAANEAVARYLTDRRYPLLYRVHPEPEADTLDTLFGILSSSELCRTLGKLLPAPSSRRRTRITPARLQSLLSAVRGTPQEYIVSRMALRSMMQASYSPALEPHFGLASECYCHFTSPIRRYADLVVHRALKAALGSADATAIPDKRALAPLADHLRATERAAMTAERELQRRLTTLLLRESVGQEFTGVISGLADFGIFVELPVNMAEGMIRVSSLTDDYYVFNPKRQELRGERNGKAYILGQEIKVRVAEVNTSRLEITLEPGDGSGACGPPAVLRHTAKSRSGRRSGNRGCSGNLRPPDRPKAPRKKHRPRR